jgi:lantibiotic modifying enzyme
VIGDHEMRREIRISAATTQSRGFGLGYGLCHGDLGNIELVTEAARVLDDPCLAGVSARMADRIVADLRENLLGSHGLRLCTTPGLMTGLSGIGYGLLRLTHRNLLPSLLTLEPPRKGRRL